MSGSKSNSTPAVFPSDKALEALRDGNYANRIKTTAAVYCASVMEYVVAEIIESVGNDSNGESFHQISSRDVMRGVNRDHELQALFQNVAVKGEHPDIFRYQEFKQSMLSGKIPKKVQNVLSEK